MTNHRRHNLEAKVRQSVMGAVNTRDQICLVAQQYTMKSNSDTLQLWGLQRSLLLPRWDIFDWRRSALPLPLWQTCCSYRRSHFVEYLRLSIAAVICVGTLLQQVLCLFNTLWLTHSEYFTPDPRAGGKSPLWDVYCMHYTETAKRFRC